VTTCLQLLLGNAAYASALLIRPATLQGGLEYTLSAPRPL